MRKAVMRKMRHVISFSTSLSILLIVFSFSPANGGGISGTIYQGDGITPVTGLGPGQVKALYDPCGETGFGAGTTPSTGQYTITGLPAGDFYIKVKTGGGEYWYDGTNTCVDAVPITLDTGETLNNVDIILPLGSISGTIYHADGITPVQSLGPGTIAAIFDLCGEAGIGGSVNIDTGQYTLNNIQAGDVYVKVMIFDAEYWYGDAVSCEDAVPVTVNVGYNIDNIDFHLPMGAISGGVYESDGVSPISDATISALSDPCGESQPDYLYSTNENGQYTITEIPEGDVYLKAAIADTECWYGDADSCDDAVPVEVISGSVTEGIDFQVADTNGDNETDGSGGGCFVATAACWALPNFRFISCFLIIFLFGLGLTGIIRINRSIRKDLHNS